MGIVTRANIGQLDITIQQRNYERHPQQGRRHFVTIGLSELLDDEAEAEVVAELADAMTAVLKVKGAHSWTGRSE